MINSFDSTCLTLKRGREGVVKRGLVSADGTGYDVDTIRLTSLVDLTRAFVIEVYLSPITVDK